MCFLGGFAHFKGVLTYTHRNNAQCLLKVKIKLLLKELYA